MKRPPPLKSLRPEVAANNPLAVPPVYHNPTGQMPDLNPWDHEQWRCLCIQTQGFFPDLQSGGALYPEGYHQNRSYYGRPWDGKRPSTV